MRTSHLIATTSKGLFRYLLIFASVIFWKVSGANTYTVTTTTDFPISGAGISVNSATGVISGGAGNGQITLRSAIAAANSVAGPHTINVPSGTFTLTIAGTGEGLSPAMINIGDLDVTANNVTIHGAGMNSTIINQTSGIDRVFDVNVNFIPDFNFTIDNLTISGGREQTGNGGGGMFTGSSNNLGTITITNIKFDNNQAFQATGFLGNGFGGGGLQHQGGDLVLSGCIFTNNSSTKSGGALSACGFRNLPISLPLVNNTMTVTNCTFTNNSCSGSSGGGNGGAIDFFAMNLSSSTVTVTGSSFSGNTATAGSGGAIINESTNLTVTKSTFLNNHALNGGAAYGGGGATNINFCRLIGNTATSTGNGFASPGSSETFIGNNNWWGVNSGPATGDATGSTMTVTKWLQLKHTASPTSVVVNPPGSSTLTASFLTNSANEAISASNLTTIIGLPIVFNNAVQGTISNAQATIQAAGTATATYTVNATACPPTGSANATVDNATVTATITIIDNIPPVITCPQNIEVSNTTGQCGASPTFSATATDNCTHPPTIKYYLNFGAGNQTEITSPHFFAVGTTTVTAVATDASNNNSTPCSFTVKVNDVEAPVISGCPSPITVQTGPNNPNCSQTATWTEPTANDNCDGPVAFFSRSHAPGSAFPVGTTQVTYTFKDSKGNTNTCQFNVVVIDNTPPVVSNCPANITVQTGANNPNCSQTVNWTEPTATDNCGGALSFFSRSNAPGSTFNVGTTQVTYVFKDAANNQSTCSFNVIVQDNTPPEITCPQDIEVDNTTGVCGASVTFNASASDNCSTPTKKYYLNYQTVNQTEITSPHVFTVGTTQVTAVATDAANNSSNPCTFNVKVNDKEAPTISNCPANITVQTGANSTLCSQTATWTEPTATDNCDGSVTFFSRSHAPGSAFNVGTTQVTYVFKDAAGNQNTCSFNVIVEDNTPPIVSNCPTDVTVQTGANNSNCSQTANWTEPTATDNCGGQVTVQKNHSPGDVFPVGTTAVHYTFTDASNNQRTCDFNVVVQDNTPPVLTCPNNVNAVEDPVGSGSAIVTYAPATATDNCSGIGVIQYSRASGTSFPVGTTTVNVSVMDGAGNQSTCSFDVTVGSVCQINCPGNIIVANKPGQCGANVTWNAPTTTGDCGNLTLNHQSGDFFPVGTTTVQVTSQSTGQQCSFTVTVNDKEAPTIGSCPTNITVQTGMGNTTCSKQVSWTEPTATDNCGGVVNVQKNHSPGDIFNVGTTLVTYTFTDAANNQNTCTFNVTVQDNTPPVLTCPNNVNALEDPVGSGSAIVTYAPATATDNCSGIGVIQYSRASGTSFPVGTTTVNVSVMDGAGNQSTCSFDVTVGSVCQINCPGNIIVANKPGQCGANVTWNAPTTTGDCGNLTLNHQSGDFFPVGTTTVQVTSQSTGQQCSFTVTVNDKEAPTIGNCPANITVQTGTGNTTCSKQVSWTEPTATDNCGGVINVQKNHSPGDIFNVGTTQVTYTFTDAANNQKTCTFNVTVQDNTPPVVSNCPTNITVQTGAGSTTCSKTVTWMEPTATDNCGGALTYFSRSKAPGSTFNVGTTGVTYIFKDAAGNQSTCKFNVTVQDNTSPVISKCPTDITVQTGVGSTTCSKAVTWIEPIATDNCGSSCPYFSRTKAPGSTFTVGTTLVTYVFKDAAGNQSTCTFKVTVQDKTVPKITCPATQSLSLDPTNCTTALPDYRPLATKSDNCGTPTITQSPAAGSLVSGTTAFAVTLTATDGSGNTASCSFTVQPNCGSCKNPTNLTSTTTSNSATLSWTASANPTEWNVEYKSTAPGSKWIDINVPGTSRSVTINCLTPNQDYNWQIRVKCGSKYTSFSGAQSFKTKKGSACTPTTTGGGGVKPISTSTISFYPNPTTGQFMLEMHLEESINATAKIQLINLTGKIVQTEDGVVYGGTLQKTISILPSLTNGTYVLKIIVNGKAYTDKLMYVKQ